MTRNWVFGLLAAGLALGTAGATRSGDEPASALKDWD